MKQSIQLRLGQHLTMTPQLQQAIRLLQLSTLELRSEVQQVLESNPLLETVEESETAAESAYSEWDGQGDAGQTGPGGQEADAPAGNGEAAPDTSGPNDTTEDLYTGSGLDDVYGGASHSGDGQDERPYEARGSGSPSLQEHLLWQVSMSPFSDTDAVIATAIIDSINDDGYLPASIEDIWHAIGLEESVELDEIEAVLHRIQHFDPIGVGARNLRECLLIQLEQLDPQTPWLSPATLIVKDYLHLLGGRDYTQLMRRARLSRPDLQQVVALIQSLDPRPGSVITNAQPEYIIPDVVVRKGRGEWRVELNPDAIPRLRINSQYAGLIRGSQNSQDVAYLKNHLQEARWFIKSLRSRHETLLKVAKCIVDHQREFLEQGEEAMKALVLHDVAKIVGMHESTISRVTTQKYMYTPRGIFELKYFFSSHVSTASGGECSSTAIRALIKKLVAGEDPVKPLSDSKIAQILAKQGINVARRTIAKYREALSIPPSNERKQLA